MRQKEEDASYSVSPEEPVLKFTDPPFAHWGDAWVRSNLCFLTDFQRFQRKCISCNWVRRWVLTIHEVEINIINPFFSEISQQYTKCMNKWSYYQITHIWHRVKCYFTNMRNAWYLITVPNMNNITTFFSDISQQTLNIKFYEKIAIITQIWHRAKFYFTSIHGSWYMIMVPNMKKIHLAIMEECMRTDWEMDGQTDGWMDSWTDGLDPFLYSPFLLR